MKNWAKTVKYPKKQIYPTTLEQLMTLSKQHKYTVLGGGHSFINIDGGGPLVNIQHFHRILELDTTNNTVTAEAGIKIHELEDFLKPFNRCICSVGSIRDQTLAGSAANCVNSLGGNYCTQFCDILLEIHCIDNTGTLRTIAGHELKYYSVHLGSLCGLIYSIKIRISDKTFLKYHDDYVEIGDLQEYIKHTLSMKKPILCEFMYFLGYPTVGVLLAEPFKPATRIDETSIPSNDNLTATEENKRKFKNKDAYDSIRHAEIYHQQVIAEGIQPVLRHRNHIEKDGINIIHYSKLWFRGGKTVAQPVLYMEFYVPVDFTLDTIHLLQQLGTHKVAHYLQLRPFKKSSHILCPSYGEDVTSILFGAYVDDLKKHHHIVQALNDVGVRWHWSQMLDSFMYDGYIERVFSSNIRTLVAEKMLNPDNMRPQLKKALTHVRSYRSPWKTRFAKNMRKCLTNF